MKNAVIIVILYSLVGFGCHKKNETDACGCHGPKTETIENVFGIMAETEDGFEILTDTKGLLIPCSDLSKDFKIESQPVIVSGTLKIPCKKIPDEFSITPIEISSLKLRDSGYNKSDISLSIIKSEDYGYDPGFGYFIKDNRSSGGISIIQPHIPAVSGLTPFATQEQATKTAMLVIYLLRNYTGLPSLSIEVLKYIKVIK